MATTEKIPSGKHRGVYYDAAGKKRHTPAVDHKRTAKAAAVEAEAQAARKAAITEGTLPGHTLYGDWYPIWWAARDVEPSTLKAEDRLCRKHVLPRWEAEEMARIEQQHVKAWLTWLHREEGHPASYVRRIYTPFRSSMTAAVDKGVLSASPCVGVKLPKIAGQGAERVYDNAELDAICEELAEEYRFAARFIRETGLRPGEFAGLHRHRVDITGGWVTVRDTYCRVARRVKTYPKDDEERAIPLTSAALELLTDWYALHPGAPSCGLRHQSGRCKSDLLFRQPNGNPMDVNNFRDRWAGAQQRAKITNPGRPYDLRHTCLTALADAEVDPWDIAHWAGHASLDQSSVYIHRSKARRMRILGKLGDPVTRTLAVVEADPPNQNAAAVLEKESSKRKVGGA